MTAKAKTKRPSSSEFDFLARLERRAAALRGHASLAALVKGIGDDAAVIRQNAKTDLVITADLLVEEIDFRLAWTRPEWIGHKALAVSLSDIAAMGAVPRWAMVSLGIPRMLWRTKFADRFYDGWFKLADRYGVNLIGGDVSRTPDRVVIDSIVMGETKAHRAVMRSGAKPGDKIFITGTLGGAAAGLQTIQAETRLTAGVRRLIQRQLRPEARVAWGDYLGSKRLATGMIDLSDGLSSDLGHLCAASSVGAVIDAAKLPIDPDLTGTHAAQMRLVLDGGEDLELLFTVPPAKVRRLPMEIEGVAITEIGVITDQTHGLVLDDGGRQKPLLPAGFDHFR